MLVATTNTGKLRETRDPGGLPIALRTLAESRPRSRRPGRPSRRMPGRRRCTTPRPACRRWRRTRASRSTRSAASRASTRPDTAARRPPRRGKCELIYRRLADGVFRSARHGSSARSPWPRGRGSCSRRGARRGLRRATARAAGGFGYDPIFFYAPYRPTLAAISATRKAVVRHRAAPSGAARIPGVRRQRRVELTVGRRRDGRRPTGGFRECRSPRSFFLGGLHGLRSASPSADRPPPAGASSRPGAGTAIYHVARGNLPRLFPRSRDSGLPSSRTVALNLDLIPRVAVGHQAVQVALAEGGLSVAPSAKRFLEEPLNALLAPQRRRIRRHQRRQNPRRTRRSSPG